MAALPSASSITRAAGAIMAQWKGAETGRIMARLMPAALAASTARSTAGLAPETTTWPPPLSLATSSTSPCAAWAQMPAACSASAPSSAAMAPSPGGTAACMESPRSRNRRAAVGRSKLPAAVSALYSPSEWPATSATWRDMSKPPSFASTRQMATETAISAGCALAVRVSSSAGPSNMRRESFWLSASSTSWKVSRAMGKASARSRPMPGAWLPWPGKTKASDIVVP